MGPGVYVMEHMLIYFNLLFTDWNSHQISAKVTAAHFSSFSLFLMKPKFLKAMKTINEA